MSALNQNSGRSRFAAFRRASRGGAAGNESLDQSMYTYVRLYRSINISCQSFGIVYDGIYFVSKVYTIINRHIPPYTVIYDILVYTSISFHILTYTSILVCNDVV